MIWVKLAAVLTLAAIAAFAVAPFRTHAVAVAPNQIVARPSLNSIVSSMYLTPGTIALVLTIVAVAGFATFQILRGNW